MNPKLRTFLEELATLLEKHDAQLGGTYDGDVIALVDSTMQYNIDLEYNENAEGIRKLLQKYPGDK
jgi:hypothetical protein